MRHGALQEDLRRGGAADAASGEPHQRHLLRQLADARRPARADADCAARLRERQRHAVRGADDGGLPAAAADAARAHNAPQRDVPRHLRERHDHQAAVSRGPQVRAARRVRLQSAAEDVLAAAAEGDRHHPERQGAHRTHREARQGEEQAALRLGAVHQGVRRSERVRRGGRIRQPPLRLGGEGGGVCEIQDVDERHRRRAEQQRPPRRRPPPSTAEGGRGGKKDLWRFLTTDKKNE